MNLPAVQHDVTDIERMARAFAGSKLFGISTPEQAIALCLIAQAEGRHPASAAQDYHIISGRPSKKADAMLRDFLASGGKVEWHALDDTAADATFSHPAGGKVRISWDMQRATKAGIKGNAMYAKYPRQMLRARVVSEGVRTVYPMATSGMYVPEEVQEFEQPREASPATAAAPMIEGTATSKPGPKPSVSAFDRFSADIAAATSEAALKAIWDRMQATHADDLPEPDFDRLSDSLNARLANLQQQPDSAPVIVQPRGEDPFGFDRIEREQAAA